MVETLYEVMRRQGITRRSFIKCCSLTATALGLAPGLAGRIAKAMETKPRIPVLSLQPPLPARGDDPTSRLCRRAHPAHAPTPPQHR